MFAVEDPAVDNQRFAAGEIVYTGPIYGFKMKAALDAAGEREAALIAQFGLTPEDFRRFRSPGSRREAILYPPDLEISEVEDGLRFAFTLPVRGIRHHGPAGIHPLSLTAGDSSTIRIKGTHERCPYDVQIRHVKIGHISIFHQLDYTMPDWF